LKRKILSSSVEEAMLGPLAGEKKRERELKREIEWGEKE
jgi:hypothetical protein